MNIDKALSHFEWKLKNHWKPTSKDIQAYNSIIDFRDLQQSENISKNENLAKLWIHQLILLARTNSYDGKRCIQVIDEILNKSVYEWCQILQLEIPMMRFNNIGMDKYSIDAETLLNRTKMDLINKEIVENFENELTENLKYNISEEYCIKFVEKQINRIINDFEK
jgi:hypothetical protein